MTTTKVPLITSLCAIPRKFPPFILQLKLSDRLRGRGLAPNLLIAILCSCSCRCIISCMFWGQSAAGGFGKTENRYSVELYQKKIQQRLMLVHEFG